MIPYIGICDFPSGEQALKTASFFEKICVHPKVKSRKLMVGVMMSFKTLNDFPSKWTGAWPKKEDVVSIFVNHPKVFNTLHFADHDGASTTGDLLRAGIFGGRHLHAMQLDMIWPTPLMVRVVKQLFPKIEIILQLNTNALDQVKDSPSGVVERLKEYRGSVSRILLDKSHGRGLGLDAEALLPFLRAIAKHLPNMGLGVAGGLGPDTMHLVEPIIREFPNISIDAQGRLRPSGSALDPINWNIADSYLIKAMDMFSR